MLITVLLLLRHLIYPTVYYVFIGYRRPRRKTLSGSLKLPFPALSLKGHTMSMFAMLHGVSPEFLRNCQTDSSMLDTLEYPEKETPDFLVIHCWVRSPTCLAATKQAPGIARFSPAALLSVESALILNTRLASPQRFT